MNVGGLLLGAVTTSKSDKSADLSRITMDSLKASAPPPQPTSLRASKNKTVRLRSDGGMCWGPAPQSY